MKVAMDIDIITGSMTAKQKTHECVDSYMAQA